jgi:hypothetical protein
MFGKITKSVTGIAKKVAKNTKAFRKVLGANPSLMSLALPPQVQVGLKVADAVGIKIPSPDELLGKADSLLAKSTVGLYRSRIIATLDKVDGITDDVVQTVEDINSIEWLW